MNNMNLAQLNRTAAMKAPDAGGASAAQPAVPDALDAKNLAEEVWRREEELKRREAEITRRELQAKAMEALTAMDMPAELAQLLDYTDEEHYKASLETLKAIWLSAVKKAVEARVAGAAPKAGDAGHKAENGSMRAAISAYYNR